MVMKKVTTLEEIIRHARMEPRHVLRLWVDLLKALRAKHEEGKFFGSLAPEGILIDSDNNIVLVDSPIAEDSPYAAPEVLAGDLPDELADVYSMGVLLFEMLTGSLDGLHEKPPSRIAGEVPRWIDPVVLRCIMPQRSRRFLDLQEIFQALQKIKTNFEAIKDST